VIRCEPTQQPHDLKIASGFPFEPPARLHPVQIAVNVKYLRSGGLNIVAKLPVAATAGALNRLADYGWIERRGGGPRSEIKLTGAGLAALQAPI
jgi:hypothetical protein